MDIDELMRASSLYRRLSAEDRARLVGVTSVRSYGKGEAIFREGDPSEMFFTVASGRVKIIKALPNGREVLLETFGPGDPFGAVAAYDGRPFPASAIAIEPTSALLLPRHEFFALLERHPTLVRGLLSGLTQRLVELTARLGELSGGRVETRLARLLLKLADTNGRPERGGIFIPLALSRQELADMTGTTIESCIRVMSRWAKEDIVRTEREGFVVVDRAALEDAASA
jgi:CRP-like cAMP-binding protein